MGSPHAIHLWPLQYETVTFVIRTATLGRAERFSSIKDLIIVRVLHLVDVIMHFERKYASTKAGERQTWYWRKICLLLMSHEGFIFLLPFLDLRNSIHFHFQ